MLEPIAEKVTIVHRRDQFRAHEHSVEQLKDSSVDILTPYVPYDLEGEDDINKVILQKQNLKKQLKWMLMMSLLTTVSSLH